MKRANESHGQRVARSTSRGRACDTRQQLALLKSIYLHSLDSCSSLPGECGSPLFINLFLAQAARQRTSTVFVVVVRQIGARRNKLLLVCVREALFSFIMHSLADVAGEIATGSSTIVECSRALSTSARYKLKYSRILTANDSTTSRSAQPLPNSCQARTDSGQWIFVAIGNVRSTLADECTPEPRFSL